MFSAPTRRAMLALAAGDLEGTQADRDAFYARRLKAALKRERGDAAKLREALAELVANIEMRSSNFGLNVMVDTKTYLDAKAALAAPPRNCDIPTVCDDPHRAWLNDKDNWNEDGDPKLEIYDWLLAPATEKEGCAK